MPEMKLPGPEHPITIARRGERMRASLGGRVIAETGRALELREANLPPVIYFPREDADMGLLERTARSTHCPYKGDASYYSVAGAPEGENAVWTYEDPHGAVAEIKDHLAFYTDRVSVEAA